MLGSVHRVRSPAPQECRADSWSEVQLGMRTTPPERPAGGIGSEGGTTSTDVTMRDLELETAELLPSREALNGDAVNVNVL